MEVLICTDSAQLRKKLVLLTDKFLCSRKARYMSVSPDLINTGVSLEAEIQKHPSSIVILDVQSFDNWQEIAENTQKLSRAVGICLVSSTAEPAVRAINSLKAVCGYICKSTMETMFDEVFSQIYDNLRTVCGGIAVTHHSSLDKVIPYDDIFFIETVKQTHLCRVVHKNGTDEIRADISKLITELPYAFQIVRSSTIVNMSMIKAYSDCELFFSDEISCFCGKKHISRIVPFIKQAALC